MNHFAHYVLREIVEVAYENSQHPWFAENQPDNQGFDAPSYHVTRALVGPAASVQEGDVIWLFSQLKSKRWADLPPALDAKIVVGNVMLEPQKFREGRQLRFSAAIESRWFPLHDASSLLIDLGLKQPIGQSRQSLRKIGCGDALLRKEKYLLENGFDFVSYRLVDGTELCL